MIKTEIEKTISYTVSTLDGVPALDDIRLMRTRHRYNNTLDHKEIERQIKKGYPPLGIYGVYTLSEVVDYTNKVEKGSDKGAHVFMAGIYKGGTSGEFKTKGENILAFDIDQKDNTFLTKSNKAERNNVIQVLKRHSIFTASSTSGKGLWGFLYVHGLSGFTSETSDEHRNVGKCVYQALRDIIKESTSVSVAFDNSQATYRQERFSAYQSKPVVLNSSPISFTFERVETVELLKRTREARRSSGYKDDTSIFAQFNERHTVEEFLPACNHSNTRGKRWKYVCSKSADSGEVLSGNVFYSNSSTFPSDHGDPDLKGMSRYTPVMLYKIANKFSWSEVALELKLKGYETKQVEEGALIDLVKQVKTKQNVPIVTDRLKKQSYQTKSNFFRDAPIPEHLREYYMDYLDIKDLTIPHDETLILHGKVSTRLGEILNIADRENKISISSATGSGKTYSIVNDLHKHRPDVRLLIIVPLRGIAEQGAKEVKDYKGEITRLYGSPKTEDWEASHKSAVVFATYEQAAGLLKGTTNVFDYIAIDEVHSLVLSNAYRVRSIKNLQLALGNYLSKNESTKIIGMTGTPLRILKDLGFYMVKLDKAESPVAVIQRPDGRSCEKIIRQHHSNCTTPKDRIIYRALATASLEDIRSWFIEGAQYKPDEVVILTGENKDNADFKLLMKTGEFRSDVKIVLTSPVIDEGVSINNKDFTQMVFIDSQSVVRPEAFKQFISRIRKPSKDMLIYQYLKVSKQEVVSEDIDGFEYSKREIDEIINERRVGQSTYNSILSYDFLMLKNGELNELLLALSSSNEFFKNLTIHEFNQFLSVNYNIEVDIDLDYIKENIKLDKQASKINSSNMKNIKTDIVKNKWPELLSAMWVIYKGKEDELSMIADCSKGGGWTTPKDELLTVVKEHKNHFLQVLKFYSSLSSIGLDPDSYMFNGVGKLENASELVKKNIYLRLYLTLKGSVTIEDRQDAERFNALIKGMAESGSHVTISKLRALWVKNKIPKKHLYGANSEVVIQRIITTLTDFVYCRKRKVFCLKSENKKTLETYLKKWIPLRPEIEVVESKQNGQKYERTDWGLLNRLTGQIELEL